MKENIYLKIAKAQKGDKIILEELIEMFNPIINKYSKLLNGEDTKQDLILHLIEILKKIPLDKEVFFNDKIIFSYLIKSIRNQYIYLSKKNSSKISNESLLNIEWEFGDYDNFESELELLDSFKILTKKESFIIRCIYINYLSISELAAYMNISRQAVNQSKNRALKKLRKIYLS